MSVLFIEHDGAAPRYLEISTDVVRIGRDRSCDVVLASQFVSRFHAELRSNEGRIELVDLDSANGTTLNGRQVDENTPYVLADGDMVRIEDFTLVLKQSADALETIRRERRAADELYVDIEAMAVWIGERRLELRQARVLKLLAFLFTNRTRVCSEEELGNHVWASGGEAPMGVALFDSASLHQLVYLARRSIEPKPARPAYLVNVPGLGYRLNVRPGAPAVT